MPGVSYFVVSSRQAGQKLFQLLNRYLDGQVPRSALMRWIRTGQVRLDGRRSSPFVRVSQGQKVRLPPYTPGQALEKQGRDQGLSRVFEDEHILVLNKPAHLATQPGSRVTDSVHARIRQAYHEADWMPALVHRLDKETSGLLVLAKNYKYLRYLQNLWQQRQVRKVYLTWVSGPASWERWVKIEDQFKKQRAGGGEKTQQAVSWVKTVFTRDLLFPPRVKESPVHEEASLLAVRLVTGRKHQIRNQLARRGYPIIGDKKFHGPAWSGDLLLHSSYLAWDGYEFFLPPPWQGRFALDHAQLEMCLISFRDQVNIDV